MNLLNSFTNAFGGGLFIIPLGFLLAAAWTYFARYKKGVGGINPNQKGTLVYAGLEVLAAIICAILMWAER